MKTSFNRRRFVGSLMLSSGSGVASAPPPAQDLEAMRIVSKAHGISLTDARLAVLKPVLESRQAQLQALREFDLGDEVAPATRLPHSPTPPAGH